jgi:hypothetical protein
VVSGHSAGGHLALWAAARDRLPPGSALRVDDDDFVVDRWNFLGKYEHTKFGMHIPKKLIFPSVQEEFFSQKIKLPACRELLCEWLYGKSWRTPRTKNVSYVIRIIENRPLLIKPIPRAFERFIPKPIRPIIERLIN